MDEENIENQGQNRWYSGWLRWCPTSDELLQAAEARILKSLSIPYKGQYVTTSQQDKIWTVSFNPHGNKTPVLMVHGFGAGLGIWTMNIEELSKDRPVCMFDLLGFARSSRPHFEGDPHQVEETFVNSIEDTRKGLGLEKFIIIGHSFGAYLAYAYAIKHPDKVKYLILADPWGFSEKPVHWDKTVHIPTWLRVMATVLQPFNPFSGLRFAGPLGPSVLRHFRPDLQTKFSHVFDDDTILNYIYHCNAQTPSGESGFKRLVQPYGWAKYPMIHRVKYLNASIKVGMMFGDESWINNSMLEEMAAEMPDQFDMYTIKGAGHHIYADQPHQFNELVTHMFKIADNEQSKEVEVEIDSQSWVTSV